MFLKSRSNFLTILYTIIGLISFSVFAGTAYASEDAGEPTLFLNQDCPQCDDVLSKLELANTTGVKVFYLEDPTGEVLYTNALAACTLSGRPVPMLYMNDECVVGDAAVNAQITQISQEAVSDQEDIESRSAEDNREGVEDSASKTDVAKEPAKISPLVLLASLVAPILLIGIGYYLITKLKL